ncbi:MAG: hypothetical protein AABZ30_13335 [Myxococcota bacterium]
MLRPPSIVARTWARSAACLLAAVARAQDGGGLDARPADGGASDGSAVDAAGDAPASSAGGLCTTSDDCFWAFGANGRPLLGCVDGYCVGCATAVECHDWLPAWNACVLGDDDEPACAECADEPDCAANPDALGPACDEGAGFCTCEANADCTANPNGAVCRSGSGGYCGCRDDCDCEPGSGCSRDGPFQVCRPGTNRCGADLGAESESESESEAEADVPDGAAGGGPTARPDGAGDGDSSCGCDLGRRPSRRTGAAATLLVALACLTFGVPRSGVHDRHRAQGCDKRDRLRNP